MRGALAALVLALLGQAVDRQAVPRVVAADRALAAAAAEQGLRDALLAYRTPESVRLTADPETAPMADARAAIAAWPLVALPLAQRDLWEPFTGQVSADGQLAWTAGARAVLNLPIRSLATAGGYFHVWRLQPGGTWRVWLRLTVPFPAVWQDAAPFSVMPPPDASGDAGPDAPIETLDPDAVPGGDVWRAHLAAAVRVHRAGAMPLVGREAVVADDDLGQAGRRRMATRILAAASGDLAVTCGVDLRATDRGGRSEAWARVWQRDPRERWRIVFETRGPLLRNDRD